MANLTKGTWEAHRSLCSYQAETLSNPSSNIVEVEAEAYEKWRKLLELEEAFLKQKFKVHWLEVGGGRWKQPTFPQIGADKTIKKCNPRD